jgi:large-conductance mechanosensitive channel
VDSTFQILLSVVGAEAATGAFDELGERAGEAVGNLARLAGAALSLEAAFEGVKGAFELGEHFQQLSSRTGQSVQDLVVLSRAFQMVGLSGDEVGLMANRLQRSMSGMNEMGQSTSKAFAELGLDVGKLGQMSFNDQLQALGDGFARIKDPAERASVAMQIFGRAGGQMLQLLTKEGLLSQAGEDAGRLASRLQDDSEGFENVSNRLSVLKIRFQEMFVVIAEKISPALSAVASLMGGLNLAPIGAALGTGGAVALGGVISSSVVSKLDTSVTAWAKGTGVGSEFAANFLAPLTGGLATFFEVALPPLIIAAIVGGVVFAIAQSISDANRAIADLQKAKQDETDKLQKELQSATSQDDVDLTKEKVMSQLQKAEARIKQLEGQKQTVSRDDSLAMHDETGYVDNGRAGLSDLDAAELEALNKQAADLRRQLSTPVDGHIIDVNRATADLAKMKDGLDQLAAHQAELDAKNAQLRLAAMPLAQQASTLATQRTGLQASLNQRPEGISNKEDHARRVATENQILEIQKQEEELQKRIQTEAQSAQRQAEEVQRTIAAGQKKQADDAEKIHLLQLETQMEQAKAAGDVRGAEAIKEQIDLIRYKKELADLGVTDLSSADQRVAAERQLFQVEQQRREQNKADQALKESMEMGITRLQNAGSAAQGSGVLTDTQKYAVRKQILEDEIALRQKYVAVLQQQYNAAQAAGDKVTAASKEQQLVGAQRAVGGAQDKLNQIGPDPNSFSAQWTVALTKLQQGWQTTWQSVGQTFTTIVNGFTNSISTNITGLIMQTQNWHRALQNIASSLMSEVVGAIVQMGVKWIATQLMMAIFGNTLAAAQKAATLPIAAAQYALWIPAATAAATATAGGAAVAAPAQIQMAVAASESFAMASSGGFFPGDPTKPRGIFHGDEVVFSAPAVRNLGAENLLALHAAGLSSGGTSSSSSSTARGGRSGSQRPERSIVYADHSVMRDALMRDPAFTNHIVDVGQRRRGQIFSQG